METQLKFAVFIDYDNIAIGVKNTLNRPFDYRIVSNWLQERGEVLAQIAYGNWNTHSDFKIVSRSLTRQGVQMEHLETAASGSKNGADIALSIDAVELVFTQKHIDAFCILSGDSDFLPLVHKLKKHNKRVYVVAGNEFTSNNLQSNCHEFISYEALCGLRPIRYDSAPVSVPLSSRTHAEPIENAVPTVRRALREMDARGEVAYIKQLRTAVMRTEPRFDERAYGCDSFKDLIIQLVNAGHFRRKMLGAHRFCIAEVDFRREPSHEVRSRPIGRDRFQRRAYTGPPAGRGKFRSDRKRSSMFRGAAETSRAVKVINEAVKQIEHSGKLAELDLLHKTILEIDSQFPEYGCSSFEFRQFVGKLAMDGHFRLKTASGAYVVEPKEVPDSPPVQAANRLADSARGVLDEIVSGNRQLLQVGLPNKQLEVIVSMQSGFDEARLGVDSPGHFLELAVREGLLNARRDSRGVVRYFAMDASPEALEAIAPSAREPSSAIEQAAPAIEKRPAAARAMGPAKSPPAQATSPRAGSNEPRSSRSVDDAVEAACMALRNEERLFKSGLHRSELRTALQESAPDFDLKTYGVRTFRVLLDCARKKGYLETRVEDDAGLRYYGTDMLSGMGSVKKASDSEPKQKRLLRWLKR